MPDNSNPDDKRKNPWARPGAGNNDSGTTRPRGGGPSGGWKPGGNSGKPEPDLDYMLRRAQATFNPEEQTTLLAKAHAIIVDEAPWLFIVHDLNPRAMSAKVKDFKPAQSWSQDFTQITMA